MFSLLLLLLLLFLREKNEEKIQIAVDIVVVAVAACCPYLVSMFESMFDTLMAYMFSEHRKRCFALRITTQPTGMVTVSHFIFEFR